MDKLIENAMQVKGKKPLAVSTELQLYDKYDGIATIYTIRFDCYTLESVQSFYFWYNIFKFCLIYF